MEIDSFNAKNDFWNPCEGPGVDPRSSVNAKEPGWFAGTCNWVEKFTAVFLAFLPARCLPRGRLGGCGSGRHAWAVRAGSVVEVSATFPRLSARDLTGNNLSLPADLPGELTVVVLAFQRDQQALVDSWVPWLGDLAAEEPRLRFVELPTIGRHWAPARPMIDGGMASAIRDEATRLRTLTVYADVRRVTNALEIEDRDTIWLFLVDRAGAVRWRGSGGFDSVSAASLAAALADRDAPVEASVEQFELAFDPKYRLPLAALGVLPSTAHVTVSAERLVACFGPWSVRTAPANVREVCLTGPYRGYRAIGPRMSMVDRGLTFGSTVSGGVCLLFSEPVAGLDPFGRLRHPGLTVTVAERDRFAAVVRRFAGLS